MKRLWRKRRNANFPDFTKWQNIFSISGKIFGKTDHFSSYDALPSNFKATLVPENIHNFVKFFFSKFCSFFINHISYFMKVWEISASAILIADDIISGWFVATSDITYCQRLPSSAKKGLHQIYRRETAVIWNYWNGLKISTLTLCSWNVVCKGKWIYGRHNHLDSMLFSVQVIFSRSNSTLQPF